MSTKKLILAIVTFLVIFSVVFAIVHFSKTEKKKLSSYEEYAEYISAFTSGHISKNSEIVIEFNSGLAINKQLQDKDFPSILSFEPAIEGHYYWKNESTLAFRPKKPLPYNQQYIATLKIGSLLTDNAKLKDFIFSFTIIPQTFTIDQYQVKTLSEKDYSLQKVIAFLKLTDTENEDDLRQCISVKIDGKKLPFKLVPENTLAYRIEIDSIQRTNQAQQLTIQCNGKSIGVDAMLTKQIEIPAISEFKVLDVFVNQYPEQSVLIVFSDPIDNKQDLGGLISFNPEIVVRYTVDKNNVWLYPSDLTVGDYELNIVGVNNTKSAKLPEAVSFPVTFADIKPQVKFADEGFMIPSNGQGSLVPILTMNLKEIDVRVIQIYENNVLQFLQSNDYDGASELRRVGKVIYKGTVNLNVTDNDKNAWKRFNLDISKFVKADPGSWYRISLGFRQHQTLYSCNQQLKSPQTSIDHSFDYFDSYDDYEYYYYYDEEYYENYWENRENPCHKAYYGSHHCVSKNVYVSDIALIAKKTPTNKLYVFASDVTTAEPMNGVEIEVYDFPKQLIYKATTDGEGKVVFDLKDEPSFVIAKKSSMRSFLKLSNQLSLSMASYDISGQSISNGINGYIYGERGVWRPGDSLYLTFVLQEADYSLPAKQPIIFEIYDPSRNLIKKQVMTKNESNVYVYRTSTEPDAATGNYLLQVKVAKSIFSKTLKIETVKPNRLKIFLTSNKEILSPYELSLLKLHSEWLHGAMASNLKALVTMMLYPVKTTFKGYETYTFDDVSKKFYPQEETVFSGTLNDEGDASFSPEFTTKDDAPGMMKAVFTTKVFEKGGEFSIDQKTLQYSPYKTYVGLTVKEDEKDYGMLYTDKDHLVNIVTLNNQGKLEAEPHNIAVYLYKLDWRWWWDQSDDYIDLNYRGYSYVKMIQSDTIQTLNGKANWKIRINKPEYGRFLLLVKDLQSEHSASKVIYIDWSDWKARVSGEREQSSTQLVFTTDKEQYNVGDEVVVSFPGSSQGRALVSIENSKGIIQYAWIKTVGGINTYRFKATPEMTPNVYINITLIQAYQQTENDKPIRLYGLRNIGIQNPASHLYPQVETPKEFKAEQTYTITVSEKNGKEMYYTLAIVDEGLLALTRYTTPNLWEYFYSKEAYSFLQWDLYDFFIKGLTGKLTNIIGIGGDEALEQALDAIEAQKAKRFKPMIIFEGLHHLKSGRKNSHTIKIPNYMGEVRVMVVARYQHAYGSFAQQVKVVKPVMVMPSLPKVLSVEDKIIMPVSVFSNVKNLKNALVSIKVTGPLTIEGQSSATVALTYNKEANTFFTLKAGKIAGMAKVEVIAVSGNERSAQSIDIYVRNPNPFTTKSSGWLVEAGKTKSISLNPLGVDNTNYTTIEVSAIPSLNLERHINYLTTYPHGCLEQIVSSAFPQLYLTDLMDLPPQRVKEIEFNIKSTIQRIIKYQTSSGGFSYWPGYQDVDDWVTSYCGHFMIEAQKAGYKLPANVLSRWKTYQRMAAQKWYSKGPSSQYIQAYRLYTMALSGNADISAMNRLAAEKQLNIYASYPLATAYALAGKHKMAGQILNKQAFTNYPAAIFYDIYGSEVREESFIALAYTTMNQRAEAFKYVKEIATKLSSNAWYSTQSLSFALIACSNYLKGERMRTPMNISYAVNNGKQVKSESMKYFLRLPLDNANKTNTLSLTNHSSFPVYVQFIQRGILPIASESYFEKGLSLKLSYTKNDGSPVELSAIKQTDDLYAVIQVTNNTNDYLSRLALTYTIPSGWEILNDRMLEMPGTENITYDHKDIRDDKVMYYFSLSPRQTKTFKVPVNASFAGRFYHPLVLCEDMYNSDIAAQLKGQWIEIPRSF